jgi:hypothetical protein
MVGRERPFANKSGRDWQVGCGSDRSPATAASGRLRRSREEWWVGRVEDLTALSVPYWLVLKFVTGWETAVLNCEW